MQINGEWLPGDDELLRPIIRAQVLASDGTSVPVPFLVDTGADCTVFSAPFAAVLQLPLIPPGVRIGGMGRLVPSQAVETTIQLTTDDGGPVTLHGQFAIVTDAEALDMSILGRDIMDLFAVIVDRPGEAVCLLGQRHTYSIVQR